MHIRYFLFLSRLQRFLPNASGLATFDAAFLQLPMVKWLAGCVVLWT
jgi:hypothetical protein